MAREIALPVNPRRASRPGDTQTPGDWLAAQMSHRSISNKELFERLQRLGYAARSGNMVSMWRTDRTPISLDVLPLLLQALNVPFEEHPLWCLHFLQGLHPGLLACITGSPSVRSEVEKCALIR